MTVPQWAQMALGGGGGGMGVAATTGCVSTVVGAAGVGGGTAATAFGATFLVATWAGLLRATGSFDVEAAGAAIGAGELAAMAAGGLRAGMATAGVGAGVGAERICTSATPMASVVAPKAPTAAHNQRLGAD